MNIKQAIITHHAYTIPASPRASYIWGLGANSDGKIRIHIQNSGVNQFFEYDMSNIIEGIVYRQRNYSASELIEGARIEGEILHIDVHDDQSDYAEHIISELKKDFKYVAFDEDTPEVPDNLDATIVFPAAETHAEWVDRMERLLAACAQNYEAAMGSIHSQHYTRLHDALTAKPSTDYLVRQTNTSVHCRWQIGWLWERVDRIKRKLRTTYTKAQVEAKVQALYANMKTPQHIKQFFHRHDTQEWSKLRNQSESTGENKRHIALWDTDYTKGTLLADLTARATFSGIVDETTADASMFEYGVTEYTKAAKHPNWELITERIY